jgi:hypothetical protein
MTLVWSSANPNGVTAVYWRYVKSSMWSRKASVNEALRYATGEYNKSYGPNTD